MVNAQIDLLPPKPNTVQRGASAIEIMFVVHGLAQPAGSKTAGRAGNGRIFVRDANPRSREWKDRIAKEAGEAMLGRDMILGPVHLVLTFVRPRPAGHYGSGRNAHLLRASAPVFPAAKPDLTKLVRGLEDALTGIVWRDDSQVVQLTATKQYGDKAVVYVRVSAIGEGRIGE